MGIPPESQRLSGLVLDCANNLMEELHSVVLPATDTSSDEITTFSNRIDNVHRSCCSAGGEQRLMAARRDHSHGVWRGVKSAAVMSVDIAVATGAMYFDKDIVGPMTLGTLTAYSIATATKRQMSPRKCLGIFYPSNPRNFYKVRKGEADGSRLGNRVCT